jgi:hypothetical protein
MRLVLRPLPFALRQDPQNICQTAHPTARPSGLEPAQLGFTGQMVVELGTLPLQRQGSIRVQPLDYERLLGAAGAFAVTLVSAARRNSRSAARRLRWAAAMRAAALRVRLCGGAAAASVAVFAGTRSPILF